MTRRVSWQIKWSFHEILSTGDIVFVDDNFGCNEGRME
jgi:hypothetical protein